VSVAVRVARCCSLCESRADDPKRPITIVTIAVCVAVRVAVCVVVRVAVCVVVRVAVCVAVRVAVRVAVCVSLETMIQKDP